MSKMAFLFPGQGSHYVGMGRDLFESFPEARARFEAADAVLGFSITEMMFAPQSDEAEATLKQTEITQPALYVHSLAVAALLIQRGIEPAMAAGHSLGEYSVLAAVGALSFDDGLRVVRLRGELMAEADEARPGTMAAVLGLDDETVQAVCRDVSANGVLVQPANFNAPGQVVISGEVEAVHQAMDLAIAHGAWCRCPSVAPFTLR